MTIPDPAFLYVAQPKVGRDESVKYQTGLITGGAPSYFKLGEGGWAPYDVTLTDFHEDGGSQVISGTVPLVPIIGGTLSISGGPTTVTDTPNVPYDGSGTLANDSPLVEGAGTGTINYKTGAFTITFNISVSGGTKFTAVYQTWGSLDSKAKDIDTGDGSTGPYSGTLRPTRVYPGSVVIQDSNGQILTDDGAGALIGDGSGTIDYDTGAVAITAFTSSVPVSNDIRATWLVEGEPLHPDTGQTALVADSDSELFSYQKTITSGDLAFQGAGTGKTRLTMTLDASEANDDGNGNPPYFCEGGIFSANDVLLVYFRMPKIKKTASDTYTQALDLSIPVV